MSTSFPVKCHLPLITTRIEFKFNVLSPPPQITARRDLGAHIRRQNRRDLVAPYYTAGGSRSTHIRDCDRDVTPARSQSVRFNRSESPLSDLSDDKTDDKTDDKSSGKIKKPAGEAGRANSGGYDLQTTLGWDYERYNKFSVSPQVIFQKSTSIHCCYRSILMMRS
jgi:hypothetical protein